MVGFIRACSFIKALISDFSNAVRNVIAELQEAHHSQQANAVMYQEFVSLETNPHAFPLNGRPRVTSAKLVEGQERAASDEG